MLPSIPILTDFSGTDPLGIDCKDCPGVEPARQRKTQLTPAGRAPQHGAHHGMVDLVERVARVGERRRGVSRQ
jgi:hypothetical protein